jgi:hypothetical protein
MDVVPLVDTAVHRRTLRIFSCGSEFSFGLSPRQWELRPIDTHSFGTQLARINDSFQTDQALPESVSFFHYFVRKLGVLVLAIESEHILRLAVRHFVDSEPLPSSLKEAWHLSLYIIQRIQLIRYGILDVLEVKLIGTLAMIDDGETDWKMIVIDVKDPIADKLNTLDDVEREMPGFLQATREWFRIYKMPDGKPENVFAFDGEYKDKAFADQIIAETYQQWQTLVRGEAESSLAIENVSVDGSKAKISAADAQAVVDAAPAVGAAVAVTDMKASRWFYLEAKN